MYPDRYPKEDELRSAHIVNKGTFRALDLFGPTLEFLTLPEEADAAYCVMMGTIPSGGSMPLHCHPDTESFFLVSGVVKVLSERDKETREIPSGDRETHSYRSASTASNARRS
jgi:quercetin dioxygenase-like cupin family protein